MEVAILCPSCSSESYLSFSFSLNQRELQGVAITIEVAISPSPWKNSKDEGGNLPTILRKMVRMEVAIPLPFFVFLH